MRLILKNKALFFVPICICNISKAKVSHDVLDYNKMALIKVCLRHDQLIEDVGKDIYQDETVKIYAPSWVRDAIQIISDKINPHKTSFLELKDRSTSYRRLLKFPLDLKDIVLISRNESGNVTGNIAFHLYEGLIDSPQIIYSLKDIVRQTIIVGFDETVAYGGYPGNSHPRAQATPVIIIDMIGLQFQKMYNTGRLVFYHKKLPRGFLDDFIYKQVVGENKVSYQEALNDNSGRYVEYKDVIFDTRAYEMFVANDLLLACVALNRFTERKVKLKFLKYGTGYFAGPFGPIVENHIYRGIVMGLGRFFKEYDNKVICALEFPFYRRHDEILEICNKHGIECKFTMDDALKKDDRDDLLMATTNCADPHAMPGNEMGYSSVDASIAQNLKSKAFKFNPAINLEMGEEFIDLDKEKRMEDRRNAPTKPGNSGTHGVDDMEVDSRVCTVKEKTDTFSKI